MHGVAPSILIPKYQPNQHPVCFNCDYHKLLCPLCSIWCYQLYVPIFNPVKHRFCKRKHHYQLCFCNCLVYVTPILSHTTRSHRDLITTSISLPISSSTLLTTVPSVQSIPLISSQFQMESRSNRFVIIIFDYPNELIA